jgi:hydroxymethylglutaryl-CoA lyase
MNGIRIHEVGPRDGLQAEKTVIPTAQKIRWIETILASGVDVVQLGSFVNPERVPQMADTAELFRYFSNGGRRETALSALVLNEKGLDRGLQAGVRYFCMGVSASDTHSRRNVGLSTAEALEKILPVAKRAIGAGVLVQVSVQSAFGCGYEGRVPSARVLEIVDRYLEAGLIMISLADTAGHGQPRQVEDLFGEILLREPLTSLACHFHDTYGLGMANCYAALRAGVISFETSVGGLGGCPFAAVTSGNVPTEDLVHMLQSMGMRQNIALDSLIEAATVAEEMVGHPIPGRIHATGPIGLGKEVPA